MTEEATRRPTGPHDRDFKAELPQNILAGLTVSFAVTDLNNTIPVEYTGVLPDLFAEGEGVVTHGRLQDDGRFVADRVLAKHDENYMSPEVKKALEEAGHPVDQKSPTTAAAD